MRASSSARAVTASCALIERSPFTKAAHPARGKKPMCAMTQSFKAQQRAAGPREDRHVKRGRRYSRRTRSPDDLKRELESIDGPSSLRSKSSGFPRKEVMQPHLPVRLPCYDFTPIINPTFDGCLLLRG